MKTIEFKDEDIKILKEFIDNTHILSIKRMLISDKDFSQSFALKFNSMLNRINEQLE